MFDIAEKQITVHEFLQRDDFEEGYQYELINGEIVKKQAPSPAHQMALVKILVKLEIYVNASKLGRCLCAPLDVYFTELDYYQPDIIFISKDRLHIITPDGVEGAPDLVVEILSPSTARHDRDRKMKIYRRTGVREYWVADPNNRSIEIYAQQDGDFEMTDFAMGTGEVRSRLLEGLVVDVAEVFG